MKINKLTVFLMLGLTTALQGCNSGSTPTSSQNTQNIVKNTPTNDVISSTVGGDGNYYILTENNLRKYDVTHNIWTTILLSTNNINRRNVAVDKTGNIYVLSLTLAYQHTNKQRPPIIGNIEAIEVYQADGKYVKKYALSNFIPVGGSLGGISLAITYKNGYLYIGGQNGDIYEAKTGGDLNNLPLSIEHTKCSATGNVAYSIAADRDNNVYVSCLNSVYYGNPVNGTAINSILGNSSPWVLGVQTYELGLKSGSNEIYALGSNGVIKSTKIGDNSWTDHVNGVAVPGGVLAHHSLAVSQFNRIYVVNASNEIQYADINEKNTSWQALMINGAKVNNAILDNGTDSDSYIYVTKLDRSTNYSLLKSIKAKILDTTTNNVSSIAAITRNFGEDNIYIADNENNAIEMVDLNKPNALNHISLPGHHIPNQHTPATLVVNDVNGQGKGYAYDTTDIWGNNIQNAYHIDTISNNFNGYITLCQGSSAITIALYDCSVSGTKPIGFDIKSTGTNTCTVTFQSYPSPGPNKICYQGNPTKLQYDQGMTTGLTPIPHVTDFYNYINMIAKDNQNNVYVYSQYTQEPSTIPVPVNSSDVWEITQEQNNFLGTNFPNNVQSIVPVWNWNEYFNAMNGGLAYNTQNNISYLPCSLDPSLKNCTPSMYGMSSMANPENNNSSGSIVSVFDRLFNYTGNQISFYSTITLNNGQWLSASVPTNDNITAIDGLDFGSQKFIVAFANSNLYYSSYNKDAQLKLEDSKTLNLPTLETGDNILSIKSIKNKDNSLNLYANTSKGNLFFSNILLTSGGSQLQSSPWYQVNYNKNNVTINATTNLSSNGNNLYFAINNDLYFVQNQNMGIVNELPKSNSNN